jgi:hypothetical protein
MQIICEFCGVAVNVKEDDCCPNCGASYADNQDYQERKRLELENEKLRAQKEKAAFNRKQYNSRKKAEKARQAQIAKIWMITVFSLVFLLPFLIAFIIGMVEGLTDIDIIPDSEETIKSETEDLYSPELDTEPTFISASGNFQEKISNGVYSVRVTEIKEIDRYPFQPTDGYMYIAIHFILTNDYHSDFQMWEEHVDCIIDGFVQERSWDSTLKDISSDYIAPGLSINGWEIYEVPKDIKTIQIKYGSYITINIDPNHISYLLE